MKEIYVKDLRKDQEFTEFFMAKTAAIKVGSNGKQYLDIALCDKTGDISGKKWDVSDSEYPALAGNSKDKGHSRRMGRTAADQSSADTRGCPRRRTADERVRQSRSGRP